tara:strand:+ start:21 stop:785 length:765 start_codon:yes stop_codon:yes gene_type:complete
MSKTKISCIIPTCNRKELLKITLDSVLNQSLAPDEIFIMNNGDDIIDFAYLDLAPENKFNIKIVNLPTITRLAELLNFGSSLASTEYLAFLEDDDLWEKDYIKKLSESITPDFEVYVTRCDRLKNGIVSTYKNAKGKLNLKNLFSYNPGVNISNMCINKKALFSIKGFDTKLLVGIDKSLIIDFILKNYKIKVLDQIQEIGRYHDGVRLSSNYKNVINSQIAFYQKYKNHMSLMQRVRIIYSVLYLKIFQKVKK